MWIEPLLELRPTNVMHQLGVQSMVPVLNARDLLFGLHDTNAVLWVPRAESEAEIAGLLRAAAHSHAPLGLSLFVDGDMARFQHEHAVGELVWKCTELAKSLSLCPPICFHVQLPSVDFKVDSELDSASSMIMACVEAGFTSFGLNLRNTGSDDDFSWVPRVLTPAQELELALAVLLDFSLDGDAGEILQRLRSLDVFPDVLLLSEQSKVHMDTNTFEGLFEENPGLRLGWVGESNSVQQGLFRASFGECILKDERRGEAETKDLRLRLEAKAYTRALIRLKHLGLKKTAEHIASRLVSR